MKLKTTVMFLAALLSGCAAIQHATNRNLLPAQTPEEAAQAEANRRELQGMLRRAAVGLAVGLSSLPPPAQEQRCVGRVVDAGGSVSLVYVTCR